MTTAETLKRRKRAEIPAELLVGNATVMRPVAEEDLSVLQAWDDDPEIIALMGRRYVDSTASDWFRTLATERSNRAWVIENREGRLVGELELAQLNWRNGSTELRICIGEKDCWNQGYGSDAIRTAMRMAFEGLGLQIMYLRVFASNDRAVHVYKRIGFRTEAMLQPSSRRNDPSPVLLMNLTRERWHILRARNAS
jgi:RimJ/RimL family protein N-acetyltransferase